MSAAASAQGDSPTRMARPGLLVAVLIGVTVFASEV